MTRLVVALPIEARPFVRCFGLSRDPRHSAFPIYVSERHSLIVTGIGKVASAAGVSYLELAVPGDAAEPWINVGIAGHSTRQRGEAVRAARIEDASSGQSWLPSLVATCSASPETVRTVATVERSYDRGCAYEMEASGFYPTALRFTSKGLVESIKIISDGPAAGSVVGLDRNACRELIESQTQLIEELAEELEAIAGLVREHPAEVPSASRLRHGR